MSGPAPRERRIEVAQEAIARTRRARTAKGLPLSTAAADKAYATAVVERAGGDEAAGFSGRHLYEMWCNAPGSDLEAEWTLMNRAYAEKWDRLAAALAPAGSPEAEVRADQTRKIVEFVEERWHDGPAMAALIEAKFASSQESAGVSRDKEEADG